MTGGVGGTELFPVKLETSVENSVTTGESVHYEVSESATNSISKAVSEVITNTEETACLQSCSYDANNPDRVNGFIYNWVETLYDVDMLEVTHVAAALLGYFAWKVSQKALPRGESIGPIKTQQD